MTNGQAGIQAGIQAVENTGNEEWHDFQGTETKNFVSGNVHYNASNIVMYLIYMIEDIQPL